MEPETHFNHFVRNVVMMVSYLTPQLPPDYLARFDREKLLDAFSFVHNGARVGANEWPLGPGWTGTDTLVGREYAQEDLPSSLDVLNLARLYNSDSRSDAPYGNEAILELTKRWEAHSKTWASTVPICQGVSNISDNLIIGGRPQKQKGERCFVI